MKEERVIDNSYIQNPSVSREHSDVESKPILKFMLWLTLGALVVHVLLWGLFELFKFQDQKKLSEITPLRAKALKELPKEPRLQLAPGHPTHPIEEMAQLRKYYDSALRHAPIPIEEAKRMIVAGSRSGEELSDFMIPSDMSSGRRMERRDK